MSLINQMLRDLQQRQAGRPAAPPAAAANQPPRRAGAPPGGRLRRIHPLVWVGIAGVAGVVAIVGGGSLLERFVGQAPAPAYVPAVVPEPRPSPPPAAPAVSPRRTAPTPSLAYGANETSGTASRPVVSAPVPAVALPAPRPALPRSLPPSAGAASVVRERAAAAAERLDPDLLPGAVNATSLALQQAARDLAVPPPAATPYGQAEVAYRQGRMAYESNRTEASLDALRRALAFYPGHLPARELLADQYELVGRAEEALALLRQGLGIAPDYSPFRKRIARLLLDRGDAEGASRALIGSGLPRVDEDPELHRMLVGVYRLLGENFLAAQTCRNLLAHDPRNGPLWAELGDVLAADGQPGEARKAYRRALTAGGLSRNQAALVQQHLATP